MAKKVQDNKQEQFHQEYYDYLTSLFKKAAEKNGVDFVFTLLRVSGIESGYWDPFVEGEEALSEYSKILKEVSKKGTNKNSFRMALLIYCHATEMSAPYDMLLNLVRVINGKHYKYLPFYDLIRKDKKNSFKWHMPSPGLTL